jgi:TPR repeat protein
LALCYLDGDGVKKFVKTAEKYFLKAFKHKHVGSAYYLGRIYLGLEDKRRPNNQKALKLIKWASKHGYEDAQNFKISSIRSM